MDRTEAAWMAGLLEGEGYFGLIMKTSTTGEQYPSFRVQINMTDEDVIRRLHAIAGVGTCRGPLSPKQENRKEVWSWSVYRREDVAALLSEVRPWMGFRRRDRIDEMLAAYEDSGRPQWQHGDYGYRKGCRCEVCRGANASRAKNYRSSRRASS